MKLLTAKLAFASVVHSSQAHLVTNRKRLINICSLGHATGINLTSAFRKKKHSTGAAVDIMQALDNTIIWRTDILWKWL